MVRFCRLNIKRDHLLEDAFDQLMRASNKELKKSRLYINFSGRNISMNKLLMLSGVFGILVFIAIYSSLVKDLFINPIR